MKLRTLSSKSGLRSSTSLDPPGGPRKVGIGITITTTVGLIAAQLGDTGYGIPVAIGVANLLFSAALYWKMRLILNNDLQLVDLGQQRMAEQLRQIDANQKVAEMDIAMIYLHIKKMLGIKPS